MNLFENLQIMKEADENNTSNNEEDFIYHGTKSEENKINILTNGFNTNTVYLTSTIYDAEGYGKHLVKINKNELENNLNIIVKDSNLIGLPEENINDDVDGVKFRHSSHHDWLYIILNVNKLNTLNIVDVEN